MTVQIRVATERDLPAILNLYAQPDIDAGDTLGLDDAAGIFRRMMTYPDYTLYVAVIEQAVVGTFALLIMDNLGHLGAPSGIVEDVAVAPAWQGQGIGKAMMRFAMQRCRDKQCYKLTLSANVKRHAAHHLYKSLGFRKHGYSFVIDLET
jgi:ribosomal protein S18 acetylase RimI-like enzyme